MASKKEIDMNGKTEQSFIDKIIQMVTADRPFAINHQDKMLATILPVKDYQQFQRTQEVRLMALKRELNGTLKLIRHYTAHESLPELEARLAALRYSIEQETGK